MPFWHEINPSDAGSFLRDFRQQENIAFLFRLSNVIAAASGVIRNALQQRLELLFSILFELFEDHVPWGEQWQSKAVTSEKVVELLKDICG